MKVQLRYHGAGNVILWTEIVGEQVALTEDEAVQLAKDLCRFTDFEVCLKENRDAL